MSLDCHQLKKYSDFYDLVKEIGFVNYYYPADHVTALGYEDWIIYIDFSKIEPRWSISYFHKTLSNKITVGKVEIDNNIRNFAIDDTKLLKNLFKDVLRDNKLKELGI